MKRIQSFICVLLVLLPAVAHADKIIKKDKGIINGTILSLTFTTSRGKQEYSREKIANVTHDKIILADGNTRQGTLQSVTIKTIAGSLVFKAEDISIVEKFEADELKQKYEDKLAGINQNDGVSLIELAVWCQKNELTDEMVELAGKAMKMGIPKTHIDIAHQMLGHIKQGDKWIEEGDPSFEMKEDVIPDKEPEIAQPVDQATIDAYKKIAQEYKDKITQNNESDKLAIKNEWEKKLEASIKNIKITEDRINALTDTRSDYRSTMGYNKESYDRMGDQIDAEKKRVDEMKYERAKIIYAIKKAQAKYQTKASSRNSGYRDATARIERLLGLNKALTEAEMREIFQKMVDKE